MFDKFKGFYRLSIEERREILRNENIDLNLEEIELSSENANVMIENYIFNYDLPLGIAFNFEIDGEKILIPMAVEEPSVIAAASNGAKILENITTELKQKAVVGQVVIANVKNFDKTFEKIKDLKKYFLNLANKHFTSMIKRGGGIKDIWFKSFKKEGYITIYVSVDTCDAMGANSINTFLEILGEKIFEKFDNKPILKILSNNARKSVVKAFTKTPVEKLDKDKNIAIEIAKRIEEATNYANVDPYRAVTHNKGIMNGVDAVCLATGNDWRALEASVHAFASRNGQYRSLTSWKYDSKTEMLIGEIEIPMPVATVGGTLSVNNASRWSLKLMKNPEAKKLAKIMASVGLVQNFAALRALVTDGIQKGHMSLHARSVAKQVGANENEINEVVNRLKKSVKINEKNAEKILEDIRGEDERN